MFPSGRLLETQHRSGSGGLSFTWSIRAPQQSLSIDILWCIWCDDDWAHCFCFCPVFHLCVILIFCQDPTLEQEKVLVWVSVSEEIPAPVATPAPWPDHFVTVGAISPAWWSLGPHSVLSSTKLACPSQMDIRHAHKAKLRCQGGVWEMLLPH